MVAAILRKKLLGSWHGSKKYTPAVTNTRVDINGNTRVDINGNKRVTN